MSVIDFDPATGYPAARDIAYECRTCGDRVPSMPSHDDVNACACRNIVVDPDAGRVSVRDHSVMRAIRVHRSP